MRLGPSLLGLALLTAANTAHADLLPPGGDPCANAVADGTCTQTNGQPGRCAPAKCSKLDYSQGSPPRSVETDCLRCEPLAGPATTTPPPPVGADGPPPQPATPTSETQRGCSTTTTSPAGAALLIVLLGLARRRRDRPSRSSR